MTEEEKEAIELLKELKSTLVLGFEYDKKINNSICVVLNLIEKQQKEIEECVSKDKIEEMKNELNEEFEKNNSSGIYGNDYYIESEKYAFVEEKLNELLEE